MNYVYGVLARTTKMGLECKKILKLRDLKSRFYCNCM